MLSLQEQADKIMSESIVECSDLAGDCSRCLQNVGDLCIKHGKNTNKYSKPNNKDKNTLENVVVSILRGMWHR